MPNDRASRRLVLVLAAALFVLVSIYRFNTLGGALGGFDNDHFLHFSYAKQVQAGEQPLRDFMDGGLQGARPSLTYELSAAAQRLFGNNLRSEAWLTVAGVAIGASITFVAASQVAPWPWALATALLSAWLSPKLYSYPKVLMLAVASWLIVRYAAAPARRHVLWMSAWTAIAFLFRHDYAAYCAIGFVVVIALAPQFPIRARATFGLLYGAVALALVTPSLWWIERYAGLREYVRNSIEMGSRESQRTDLAWPTFAGADSLSAIFEREQNTEAWLYYLFIAVPVAALLLALANLVRRQPDSGVRHVALISLGVITVLISFSFLRGSLEARFGDMAPLVAVLGAALLAISTNRANRRTAPWLVSASVAMATLVVTTASVWTLQSVRTELLRAGLLISPAAVVRQASRISRELATLPGAARSQEDAGPSVRAARYLHTCTRETDRVFVLAYAPELYTFSERLFGGGRASILPGFYTDERYSRLLVARLESESVPIVLAEPEAYYADLQPLANYIRERYEDRGTITIDGSHLLRVLARRGSTGQPFGSEGLPCFAADPPPTEVSKSAKMAGLGGS